MSQPAVSPQAIKPRPQMDLNLVLSCRDCKDTVPNIIEDFSAGDLVCGNCGLVLGNRVIDTRSEWRTFANDDNSGDPSRVGAMSDPLLGGNNELETTVISGIDKNSGLSRTLNSALSRVNHDKTIANLKESFKSIEHFCVSINLPRVITDSAKQTFKRAVDEKLVKGNNTEALKAASIYLACVKNSGAARTFKEISNLTKVSKKELAKWYKQLRLSFVDEVAEVVSNDTYVYRFSSQLDLSSRVQQAGVKLVKRVVDNGCLAGRSPITVVACCLFFVCQLSDDPKSAKEIAEVAQCTEATLKNSYKIIFPFKDDLGKDLKLSRDASTLAL